MSLRAVLFAGGLLCAVVPAAILGVSSGNAVRSLIVRQALAQSSASAADLASQLDEYFDERMRVVGNLAANIGAEPRLDQSTLDPLLVRAQAAFPGFTRIHVLSLQNRDLAVQPLYLNGTTTLGTYGVPIAVRMGAAAMRLRRSVIDHAVTFGAFYHQPLVRIVAPVIRRDGDIAGYVFVAINAANVREFVQLRRRDASGEVEVAAENGRIVASRDPSFAQGSYNIAHALPALWAALNQASTGQIGSYVDEGGNERVAGFATTLLTNWKVWFSVTTAEINADVASSYAAGLFWLAIAVVLAVAGMFVLTRTIGKPIDALEGTANDIASGNLGRRAPEANLTELRNLAFSINRMAETLQAIIEGERRSKARLQHALQTYGDLAARVARGELEARVTIDDDSDEVADLGTSLNVMAASLERLVAEIRRSAARIATATQQILSATSQHVVASSEEAAAVRQTAVTITQVRQTARAAAAKTKVVAQLSKRVEDTAEEGRRSVRRSVDSSYDARERMNVLAAQIAEFSRQAQDIADINTAVAELAGQSNVLAVNAAIEAANAGEGSRGFAVVASEVRELGQRSKAATVEVRRIVSEIQRVAQKAVVAAQEGVAGAEAGSEIALRSGEAMEVLVASIAEASNAAHQISASAEQQEAGLEQIVNAMQSIEQASADGVSAIRQVERAVADLNELAQTLNATIRPVSAGG